jgi:small subunit ribosomal protein S18
MTKKIKLKISNRLVKKKVRRNARTGAKHCRFANNPDLVQHIDYKNAEFLRGFLTERGKILPSRISGSGACYQRMIAHAIKKARIMALLPYTAQYN